MVFQSLTLCVLFVKQKILVSTFFICSGQILHIAVMVKHEFPLSTIRISYFVDGSYCINFFKYFYQIIQTLQWCHSERDGVSYHRRINCALNRLFRRGSTRSKRSPKLRATGLCEGNSLVTGEFPAQRASNADNVSSWCRHHGDVGYHSCKYDKLWTD